MSPLCFRVDVADEDSLVYLLTLHIRFVVSLKMRQIYYFIHSTIITTSNNLKLLWTVLIEKRNRYTHYTGIIVRNTRCKRHFNSVIVVVLLIRVRVLDNPIVVLLILLHRH